MATSKEIADLRVKAKELTERFNQDAAFKKQVTENPRATLEAAGILPEYVNEVIGQTPPGEKGYNTKYC